jgi:predicted Zn-dependent protease
MLLGQWDKALPEARQAHQLGPDESISCFVLADVYMGTGRYDEAKATVNEGMARKLDVPFFHRVLYLVALLQNDQAAMGHELSVISGSSPEMAEFADSLAAGTEAYYGRLEKARGLNRRSITALESRGKKESAATSLTRQSWTEAEVNDTAAARKDAAAALAIDSSYIVKSVAALAFARAGDSARAESLAAEITKERPSDTIADVYVLPTIRAAVELNRNNPGKALEMLQPVQAYDLANVGMLSPYERGQAYLQLRQGNEAAAEFQKLLDHPGVVLNLVLGALAHLQLGRAYALAGDAGKARAAYQDFFALWKDADADIPILKQAKVEYAKFK